VLLILQKEPKAKAKVIKTNRAASSSAGLFRWAEAKITSLFLFFNKLKGRWLRSTYPSVGGF
jgi:hypothetical protein